MVDHFNAKATYQIIWTEHVEFKGLFSVCHTRVVCVDLLVMAILIQVPICWSSKSTRQQRVIATHIHGCPDACHSTAILREGTVWIYDEIGVPDLVLADIIFHPGKDAHISRVQIIVRTIIMVQASEHRATSLRTLDAAWQSIRARSITRSIERAHFRPNLSARNIQASAVDRMFTMHCTLMCTYHHKIIVDTCPFLDKCRVGPFVARCYRLQICSPRPRVYWSMLQVNAAQRSNHLIIT